MLGSQHYIWSFIGALVGSLLTGLLAPIAINLAVDKTVKKLIHGSGSKDSFVSYLYQYESIPVTLLTDALKRAATGKELLKPIENLRSSNDFDLLRFNPVKTIDQICRENPQVNTQMIIGHQCSRPFLMEIPLLMALPVSNASYSNNVKQASLLGAKNSNAALYIKQDWFSQIVPGSFHNLILQLKLGEPLADFPLSETGVAMVELTMPWQIPVSHAEYEKSLRNYQQKIKFWKDRLSGDANLDQAITQVKKKAGGIPVLIRIRTSDTLEIDIEKAIEAGVDAIVLEGSEHGGMQLPAVIGKDFGLSLPISLLRAKSYLEQKNSKVDLIVQGRFWEPADCVKAIALGARGIILDSVLLYGMTADQITKALPWFPIETLLQEASKRAEKFDVTKAAENLANLMKAFKQEMMIAASALGKEKLADINLADLGIKNPLFDHWLNEDQYKA